MSAAAHPTGFLVLHGNRLEDLRDLVIEAIRQRPLQPLEPETFLVQSNGMKHWLQQALSSEAAFGICAATEIDLPSTFLWRAYRAVLGRAAVPQQLVFDKAAMTWRLLRLLPRCVEDNAALYAPLAHYLLGDDDHRRRWQLAQQVADVFDGYQQYRADWLEAWERDDDSAVPPEHRWQPALWRALRADVGARHENTSRAAVHRSFVAAMQAQSGVRRKGLPPRLFVFGISALPMQFVEALAELGRVCQVIVAVQNPCRHYWGNIVEGRDLLKQLPRQRQTLRTDLDLHAEAPPLLASLGKQGRDYLHLLDEFDQTEAKPHQLPRVDWFTDPVSDSTPSQGPTRLARLQSAILNLTPLPAQPDAVPRDDSIVFVQAHSAQREVEVLHDHLLALLDEDDSLQPSDIMVMVPDMAEFVSHIQAVFGRFDKQHPRHLPYSVADTSPREQPLVKTLERLLHLPDSRVSLTDWLSLFEVDAVRRRFELSESDVESLRDALDQALVRWGLDGEHRVEHGLPSGLSGLAQNTWGAGLERLLLGYAVPGHAAWHDVLPAGGLTGLAGRRIGGLAAWLDAMRTTLDDLREPQCPADWAIRLNALLDRFFEAKGDDDMARLLQRLREQLDQWLVLCETAGFADPVPLLMVREQWLAAVEGGGLQQRFFGGGVQFATLMPMRSIPFKIVCLLGMNDGAYPRPGTPRDFDLMVSGHTPETRARPGDRSRRDDDRYLFLEALLSAREKLYISWIGHRVTDNAELAPSVVIGQLRDELSRRFAEVDTPQLQPLQPFSRQYFESPPGIEPTFRTYDTDWQRLGDDQRDDLRTAEPDAGTTLPEIITLADLQRLLKQPVEIYWRNRHHVRMDEPDKTVDDDEPFDLDQLEEHQAKAAFIQDWISGSEADARHHMTLSGRLPLGAQGAKLLDDLANDARAVIEHADPWLDGWTVRHDAPQVDLALDGLHVKGSVPGLRSKGGVLLQLDLRPGALIKDGNPRYEKLTSIWVNHVCLSAVGYQLHTVICGPDKVLALHPLEQTDALRQLEGWIQCYRSAWTRPLPVACRTAIAKLTLKDEADEHSSLRVTFEGDDHNDGERDWSPYLARSFRRYDEIAPGIALWAASLYQGLVLALPIPVAVKEAAAENREGAA